MRAYAYPACRMLDDWTCFTCGQEQSGTVPRCSACQEPLCSDCVSKHRHSGFQVTWGTGDPDEPGNIQANEFYPDAEAVRGMLEHDTAEEITKLLETDFVQGDDTTQFDNPWIRVEKVGA